MSRIRFAALVVALAVVGASSALSQRARRPLARADIDNIVQLVKIEDTRQFDQAANAS